MSFLGVMSTVQIAIFTKLRGKFVGKDSFGNKYYAIPPRKGDKHERRVVQYAGKPEASDIPPRWHGWMHHQTDVIPGQGEESFEQPWQKEHVPNLTGTEHAYRPPGHTTMGGKRDAATGDYEAWSPPE